jgi:hypothetical protein
VRSLFPDFFAKIATVRRHTFIPLLLLAFSLACLSQLRGLAADKSF